MIFVKIFLISFYVIVVAYMISVIYKNMVIRKYINDYKYIGTFDFYIRKKGTNRKKVNQGGFKRWFVISTENNKWRHSLGGYKISSDDFTNNYPISGFFEKRDIYALEGKKEKYFLSTKQGEKLDRSTEDQTFNIIAYTFLAIFFGYMLFIIIKAF